jgi:hypothetical protein
MTAQYDVNPNCPCSFITDVQTQTTTLAEENSGISTWSTGTLSCNGDAYYCAQYNQSQSWEGLGGGHCTDGGINSNSPGTGCVCRNYGKVVTLITQYLLGGTWLAASQIPCGSFVVTITQPNLVRDVALFGYTPSDFRRRGLGHRGLEYPRSTLTTAMLEDQTLIVNTPLPLDTRVLVVSGGISGLYLCANSLCLIGLPDDMFYNPGSLSVTVYINDTLDSVTSIPYVSFTTCNIPQCVFCDQFFTGFGCLPWQFQMVAILVIIICILVIVVLLYKIICGARQITCCQGCGKSVTNKFKAWRERRSAGSGSEVPMDSMGSTPFKKIVFLMLLFAPLALANNCASGINVPVTASSCTVTATTETCSLSLSDLITIPAPGLDACLTFTGAGGAVFGTMIITYEQMVVDAPLALQYVTSMWSGASYSNKQCNWGFLCGSCANYDPTTNPEVCNPGQTTGCLFDAFSQQYPGNSICTSQCGCAGCNCISCDAACVYSRFWIVPEGLFCEVYQPISIGYRPQVTVNITIMGVSNVYTVDIVSLTTSVGSDFSITIEGSLAGSESLIGSNAVLQCSNGYNAFAPASAANAPIVGSIGDIQGNSYSSFNADPKASFIFASGIASPLYTSTATNYVFAAPGLKSINAGTSPYPKFPTLLGSVLWSVNGPTLIGVDASPGALVMTVSTTSELSVTRDINQVCPVATSGNITGCYSCSQGATIVLLAHSRCLAGAAVVTSTGDCDITSPSVVLSTSDQYLNVKVTSTVADPVCTVTLTAPGYSSSVEITGTLVRQDLIVVQNGTYSANATVGDGLALPDLSGINGWFSGLAAWAQGLVITAIVVASVIAAAVVIYFAIKWIRLYRLKKAAQSYQSLPTVPALPK